MRVVVFIIVLIHLFKVNLYAQHEKLNLMDKQSDLVEYKVFSLTHYKKGVLKELFNKSNDYLLVLEQKDNSSEKINMIIGANEASELAVAIEELKTARPLPSELLKSVINELGYNLSKVIIDDLKEEIFFSKLILTKDQETKIIDSRPADAITQSIRFNCGIYITKSVIEKNKM